MKVYNPVELPPDLAKLHRRAVRLEWWTLAFFSVAITMLALTLGQSQAMKAAWIEDMLALAPPIAFLVANRYRDRHPNARFPWGYHRSVSIAFLTASVALFGLGGYVVVESVLKLVERERPPIGLVELFGVRFWLGWLMIVVLALTMVPAILLGRAKQKLAGALHDKVLHADAEMNRADWLTAGAAIVGVVGIGAGLWWTDAVAAVIIGADIVRDGVRSLRAAVANLMDSRPEPVDGKGSHPLIGELRAAALDQDWVADVELRLREMGHVFAGEVLVVPREGTDALVDRCEKLGAHLRSYDWRVHDLVVCPVSAIDGARNTP